MGGSKSLRQFMCKACPGKYQHHPHSIWHKRVKDSNSQSQCKHCKTWYEPVPRGQEVGVKLCHFHCTCGNEFVSVCEMTDTAPCYEIECKEEALSPHSFEKLRKINRKSDKKHNCSKCKGKEKCPNLQRARLTSTKIKMVDKRSTQPSG